MFAIESLLASLDETACDAAHVQELLPDPYWERYQLGDWFRGVVHARLNKSSKGSAQQRWNAHKSSYKGSLADDYHKMSIREHVTWRDYGVLYKAVKEKIRQTPDQKRPGPNTPVIHLRLGDVIDGSLDSVRDLLLDQKYFYRTMGGTPLTPWEAPEAPPYW